ncbi:MAG TPA: tetratricopeptide repeat protein, partial [Candidatus Ozemobacteraceae bacterium]|nr:tetratricopeptide repeat protein [Candidatus Ozemobacteraceae bacterium]
MRQKTNNRGSWVGGLLLPAAMAVFIGLASPAAVMAEKGATDIMEKAIKQRSAGDLDGAIRNLRKALDTANVASHRSLAGFMLGDCLLEARQAADAADVYQALLAGEPSDEERAEALFRLAQCRLAMNDPAGAKKLCRQITGTYPDSPYAELARLLTKSVAVPQATETAVPTPAPSRMPSEPVETAAAVPAKTMPDIPAGAAAKRSAPAAAKSSRPVPQYEGIDPETVTALQTPSAPAPDTAPVQAASASGAAEKRNVQKPAAATPQPVAEPSTRVLAQSTKPLPTTVSAPTKGNAGVNVSDLLALPPLSAEEREALATQILHDQERIKGDPKSAGSDEVLMRIAEATARFGEPVEACRTYDRVLTDFPSSKHIERAYFEGIRLRAVIGLRPAVAQWGDAFLKTFPKSRRAGDVRRLIEWTRQAPSAASRLQTKKSSDPDIPETRDSSASKTFDPESDPRYRQAKRRVADNRFALAMNDFQTLTDAHPGVPLLWWELALVQIQM